MSSGPGTSGRLGVSCMGNGCRIRGMHPPTAGAVQQGGGSATGSHEDIPASEFMAGSGIDSYRSLPNTPSSVATIPMRNVPAHGVPPFRLRITEHSEERKRSFVRLSRKYRQAQQNQSAQVSSPYPANSYSHSESLRFTHSVRNGTYKRFKITFWIGQRFNHEAATSRTFECA